jgi:hypothetical protein
MNNILKVLGLIANRSPNMLFISPGSKINIFNGLVAGGLITHNDNTLIFIKGINILWEYSPNYENICYSISINDMPYE